MKKKILLTLFPCLLLLLGSSITTLNSRAAEIGLRRRHRRKESRPLPTDQPQRSRNLHHQLRRYRRNAARPRRRRHHDRCRVGTRLHRGLPPLPRKISRRFNRPLRKPHRKMPFQSRRDNIRHSFRQSRLCPARRYKGL